MKFLRSLSKKNIEGKVYLLRIDLNVAFEKESYRLDAVLPTLKFLLNRGAKIVILSHYGRPRPLRGVSGVKFQVSKGNRKFSLKPFAGIIRRKLGTEVKFLPGFDFQKLRWEILTGRDRVYLLENLRFHRGEEENDAAFARNLASLGDAYVNDAFAVCHRKDASVVAVAKFLPSYAGFVLEREIKFLSGVAGKVVHPFTVIIGGVKVADKIELLKKFSKRADYFLLGGGPANTFLKAAGMNIGKSVYDPRLVRLARQHLASGNVFFPSDVKAARSQIFDIGRKTAARFADIVLDSQKIIWSGPPGFYHEKEWSEGTRVLWEAIRKNRKATVVVGGGETAASVRLINETPESLMKKRKNIHFSTGGGAMMEFLAGKKLPGIEALK